MPASPPHLATTSRGRRGAGRSPARPRRTRFATARAWWRWPVGKMGAGSSTILLPTSDLICLFDESRFDPGDEMDARAGLHPRPRAASPPRWARPGPEGYVFRTDLRLRPDAGATPVCISMAAAERYYEAEGRSWNARPISRRVQAAGDIAAGERFLETLQPSSGGGISISRWCRDTMDMRRRIREHKRLNGGLIRRDGRGLSGRAQHKARRGRHPRDRVLRPDQAARGRWPRSFPCATGARSRRWPPWRGPTGSRARRQANWPELYAHHREIEHRLQMIDDAQTHVLPKSQDGFDRLARFCGGGRHGGLPRPAVRTGSCASRRSPAPSFRRWRPRPRCPISARRPRPSSRAGPAIRRCARRAGRRFFERLKPGFLASFDKAAKPLRGAAEFRRFPARTAGGRAAFLDVRGQSAAGRADRGHQRDRAAAVAVSLAPLRRAGRRA